MTTELMDFNDKIVKLLDSARFKPFTIVLAGGDRHEVTGPRQVAMIGNMILVVLPKATHAMFKKNDVVKVEVSKPAA
jgi:hypothetical protein